MINTSSEFRRTILENRQLYAKVDIKLADGTILANIDNDQLMGSGIKFEDSVSAQNKLDIGSAIINKLSLILNNVDERYSDFDFTGAEIHPQVGLQLEGNVEWLKKGVYIVDTAVTTGVALPITALDRMSLFDQPYVSSTLSYPATLLQIYRDACIMCGVPMGVVHFTNDGYVVQNRPDDKALTYREVLSCVAQIACSFARINVDGALEIKWYDFHMMEEEAHLWGGKNIDYTTGDSAFGGYLNDYASGDNYFGGWLASMHDYHHFWNLLSKNIATDDIVVTGVRVTEQRSGSSTEQGAYVIGTEGYVLTFEKNVLIQEGAGDTVAQLLGAEIIGFRFRPLNVTVQYDPSVEAGDVCFVTDRKMNVYKAIISNTVGGIGMSMTISSDAETPSANSSARYSAAAKNFLDARIAAKQEVTAYDIVVQQMNDLIANSFGFFRTEETQSDGSIISYQHDKPLLADSMTIWRRSIDAFSVSTDGGQTWNAGISKDGNAVFQILSTIGINAEWINVEDLKAIGATIGGFRIGDTYIANGTTQLGTTDNSVYVGTDGISCGKEFKIDKAGNLAATSGKMAGWSVAENGLYKDGFVLGGNAGFLNHPSAAMIFYVGQYSYAEMIESIEQGTEKYPDFWVSHTGDAACQELYASKNIYGKTVVADNILPANGWTGTVTVDGVTMTFTKGILTNAQ